MPGPGLKDLQMEEQTLLNLVRRHSGIASDDQGNIYISDFDNKRIRRISSTGQVTTIAGNGNDGFIDGN